MVSRVFSSLLEGLKKAPFFSLLISLSLVLGACAQQPATQPTSTTAVTERPAAAPEDNEPLSGRLVIYSGRTEPLIQPVIDAFGKANPGVEVLLKSGNNSELANALLEERNNPQADLFITTELFTIQALNNQGLFESYRPATADQLSDEAIGPNNGWIGITRRARVIMYNTELVSEEEAPESIFDLPDPKWEGQVSAANSSNGSMQAQIAAMRQLLGEEATAEWLRGLLANDVTFFGGHTDVRKAVGTGEFKLGLVNHYYYYLQKEEGSPVGIVFPDQGEGQIGLITNFTSAGIIKGGQNPQAAQKFVDYLISPEGQKLFAELNYEYPLLPGVPLHPDVAALDQFRLADVDVAQAAANLDETFALIEEVGLP